MTAAGAALLPAGQLPLSPSLPSTHPGSARSNRAGLHAAQRAAGKNMPASDVLAQDFASLQNPNICHGPALEGPDGTRFCFTARLKSSIMKYWMNNHNLETGHTRHPASHMLEP